MRVFAAAVCVLLFVWTAAAARLRCVDVWTEGLLAIRCCDDDYARFYDEKGLTSMEERSVWCDDVRWATSGSGCLTVCMLLLVVFRFIL